MKPFFETILNLMGNADAARHGAVFLLAAAIFFVGMVGLLILARRFDPLKKPIGQPHDPGHRQQELAMQRWAEKLDRISHVFLPKNQELQKSTMDRLSHAGYRSRNSLVIYYFIRSLCNNRAPRTSPANVPIIPKGRTAKNFLVCRNGRLVRHDRPQLLPG